MRSRSWRRAISGATHRIRSPRRRSSSLSVLRRLSPMPSFCSASYWKEEFHRMLISLDFLPNSPTLMNVGTPLGQLSACFVLPGGDTLEEIFEAIRQMALVQRTGGGTGFSFSHLRPKGDVVLQKRLARQFGRPIRTRRGPEEKRISPSPDEPPLQHEGSAR